MCLLVIIIAKITVEVEEIEHWGILELIMKIEERIVEGQKICAIRLTPEKNDRIMWSHTRNGNYSIRSAYKAFTNERASQDEAIFWIKVWNLYRLPKIKLFMWKIFAHMLPVNVLLKFYNPYADEMCPLFSVDSDCSEDVFLYWFDKDLGISPFAVNWPSIGSIVMWCIWKLRCYVVFKKVNIDMVKTILEIRRMINTYMFSPIITRIARKEFKISSEDVNHFIFVDGSFKDFNMGKGFIWCDIAGRIKSRGSGFGLIQDAVGAEATALFWAISWAQEKNLSKVIFVSDYLQLVDFVNGDSNIIGWRSSDSLIDCQSLLSSSSAFKITYIKRAKNRLADLLARRAKKYYIKDYWVHFPSFLDTLVRKEPLVEVCNSILL
ncbi:uncharacterized protein LOC113352389 [Papaver somniferum]|uniref:uncharacterized protein LOC113352389 n=1 Tax=Papaver somniferum TaxID=3469 RepID=UPI000E6F9B3A|nr:uncharacterized protein LOC113352389 [Papaver somniferum]